MKKKVLFVINSLECGGAEKSLVSLLTAFDYELFDIDLLMFRANGMFIDLLPSEVTILPEPDFFYYSRQSLLRQLKNPRYCYIKLRTSIELRKNRKKRILHDAQCYWKYAHNAFSVDEKIYDVAIAWGQGNPTHYLAEKINALKKIAFINADYKAVGYNKEFDHPFYKIYDYIVTVSDKLCELVKRVFPAFESKIKTIYDINNAELIEKMAEQEIFPECLDGKLIFVTVGRLVQPKGYDLAVKACKALADRGYAFKWFIVGEGPERINIERDIMKYGISEYMILVGAQNNPYVYMKNADIYVQTSKSEGYCLTLGEARILNIPVVSTNFDVVYNQIINNENGLIVEMDGKAIAEGIMQLINNKELRNSIIDNLKNEKKGNIEEINKLYQLIE